MLLYGSTRRVLWIAFRNEVASGVLVVFSGLPSLLALVGLAGFVVVRFLFGALS